MKPEKDADYQRRIADPAKKKRKTRVESESEDRKPADTRKSSTDRLIEPNLGVRLTPDEWKGLFAYNLDRLVRLIGLTRKDAAREMHVSYRLLRRLITAGVSRADESNLKSLKRIADFFCLSCVDDLWRHNLARDLMRPGDSKYVQKFRERLLAERKRRLQDSIVDREELAMLDHALGFVNNEPTLTGPY